MQRRQFLQMTGAALGSAWLGTSTRARGQGQRRPNILFIMSDDHTSQAIGCYGLRLSEHAPTKHIDITVATTEAIVRFITIHNIADGSGRRGPRLSVRFLLAAPFPGSSSDFRL